VVKINSSTWGPKRRWKDFIIHLKKIGADENDKTVTSREGWRALCRNL